MDEIEQTKTYLRNGDRNRALKQLSVFLRKNPQNIDAWYLMAQLVENPIHKVDCYRQILKIDPNHDKAQEILKFLASDQTGNLDASKNTLIKKIAAAPAKKTDTGMVTAPAEKPTTRSKSRSDWAYYIVVGIFALGIIIVPGIIILGVFQNFYNKPATIVTQPIVHQVTPTRLVFPTYTPKPSISNADLASICFNKSDFELGYYISRQRFDINETEHPSSYHNNLEKYYSISLDSSDLPYIQCELFVYENELDAQNTFAGLSEVHGTSARFDLGDGWGDEDYGKTVGIDQTIMWAYGFREGRVIFNLLIFHDYNVPYEYINLLAAKMILRLYPYNTR